MILLQKHCLKPGRLHCMDLSRDRRTTLAFSRRTLLRWAKEHRALRQSGKLAPVHIEHPQPTTRSEPIAMALFPSRRRRNSDLVGYLDSFGLADDGDSAIVRLAILNPNVAKQAEANRLELSPRIDSFIINGKRRLKLLSFDLVKRGAGADRSQSPFIIPRNGAQAMTTTTSKRKSTIKRMNTDFAMDAADAMDLSRLSDREVKLLRRIRETIAEVGPVSDPLDTALRILWPSRVADVIDVEDDDQVRLVETGLAALSLDRSKPAHSYAGGNRCTPAQAKAEVEQLKQRHPQMFR